MDIYEEITKLRKAGRRGALATIIQVQGSIPSYESSKILVRDDGSIVGTVGGGCVEAEVWSVAQDVMREEKPRRLHFNLNQNPEYDEGLVCGGSLDIFVEAIIDDRANFANKERFPEAVETHAGPWGEIFPRLKLNKFSYVVIATRGHKGDLTCLRWAVMTPARYVGMVGSKRKLIEFCKVLERDGMPTEQLAQVHSPVGLDIGALTPQEIAVSVVAEMIAVRRGAAATVPSMAYSPKEVGSKP